MQDSQHESRLDRHIAQYPEWAQLLARKYFTKTLIQFILHGKCP